MQHECLISISIEAFAQHPSFRLLASQVLCPCCGRICSCEGYHEQHLIYRCPQCAEIVQENLKFEPLFAQDWLLAATLHHYQIDCPFCGEIAQLVGGSPQTGLFFVCQRRCHQAFTRTIRRF